jgi:hypothetical protein
MPLRIDERRPGAVGDAFDVQTRVAERCPNVVQIVRRDLGGVLPHVGAIGESHSARSDESNRNEIVEV